MVWPIPSSVLDFRCHVGQKSLAATGRITPSIDSVRGANGGEIDGSVQAFPRFSVCMLYIPLKTSLPESSRVLSVITAFGRPFVPALGMIPTLGCTQHFSPSKSLVGTFSSMPKSRLSSDANIPDDLQDEKTMGEAVSNVILPINEFLMNDRREESGVLAINFGK